MPDLELLTPKFCGNVAYLALGPLTNNLKPLNDRTDIKLADKMTDCHKDLAGPMNRNIKREIMAHNQEHQTFTELVIHFAYIWI